jgi:hypothetical protein
MEVITNNGHEYIGNGFHKTKQADAFCVSAPAVVQGADPLNWGRAARAMEGSHLEEVKSYIKTFYETKEVRLEGMSLTIAHVAAIAGEDHEGLRYLWCNYRLWGHFPSPNPARSGTTARTHQVCLQYSSH